MFINSQLITKQFIIFMLIPYLRWDKNDPIFYLTMLITLEIINEIFNFLKINVP